VQESTDEPARSRFIDIQDPGAEMLVTTENEEPVFRERRPERWGSPKLSAGDVDASWERGDVGEEAPGGSVSTPDQDMVDEIGEALGVTYQETEELHLGEKEEERDRNRWELNPASAEDYQERAERASRDQFET
jgi:hypothetical protein